MNVMFKDNLCVVTWQKGDGYMNLSNESRFLYHLQHTLKLTKKFDLVKKRMWKDGHMVAEEQQYLRTRSWRSVLPHFCIYNHNYALYDAGQQFRQARIIDLRMEFDIFGEIKTCARCGKWVVHSNGGKNTPPEAIYCIYCNQLVCPKCIDKKLYESLAVPNPACWDCAKTRRPKPKSKIIITGRKLVIPGLGRR